MTFIKLNQADLDSPRRELSNGGLKSVVTLLVRWQINFLSAQMLTLNPAVTIFLVQRQSLCTQKFVKTLQS